ncbi:MAG: thioether cross-link-forming SCIFF peptide maturase [Oscillospiraceae bacterium]|nr:thioether cross-link-forming SCIFF peptide maturase [Oscillospiraceae bacterium]
MIHKYNLFGYNLALDVESGAIHVLSDIAMQMIDYLEIMLEKNNFSNLPEECPVDIRYFLAKYESSDVKEAYSGLCELYNNQLLFSKSNNNIKLDFNENIPVKALCLNISHDCNMNCEYCFAGKGDFGIENEKKLMDEQTGMNAINFLMQKSKGRKNLEVDFFGGEPLLNFEVVKNIVLNTRKLEKEYNKNVRFTLTTNGTLLNNEKIDFINENISNIVLSLDGLKETNDSMRKYNGGEGSYSEIVPLYQKLVSERINKTGKYKDYYIRGTFTGKNLDFVKDIIHMRELGFKNISVEPVVSEEYNDYAIHEEDLPVIFKEYENLAREIIRRDKNKTDIFNFFHFNIDLENGPCFYKRAKGCGSGSEYLAVTPNGDIYPCHQFVGNEKFKLGNVNDNFNISDIKLNENLMKIFYGNNIISNQKCEKCWVKYFCGGGCSANNEKFNNNIYSPYKIACDIEKKRVECAIAIKAILS